jgi:transposase, IS30 family
VNSDTRFWGQIRGGEVIETAVAAVDMSNTVAWQWFRDAGVVMP